MQSEGDAAHPNTEEMWDLANTLRTSKLNLPLLLGLATDDSHKYFNWGTGEMNPGRGWVIVRDSERNGNAIVTALKQGDFYASSGVNIRDFRNNAGRYELVIATEPGLDYMTRFIGTRITDDTPNPTAQVLFETDSNTPSYTYEGDELFVRATVTSSRLHPNPYRKGDHQTAWLQPVRPPGSGGHT